MMSKYLKRYFAILALTFLSGMIAFPDNFSIPMTFVGSSQILEFKRPTFDGNFLGKPISTNFQLRQGLDIQGGTQIVLKADMSNIAVEDVETALESAKEVIARRVDLYGVSEPVIQTAQSNGEYRIIVELAGVDDPQEALQLVGTTAQLDFRLQGEQTPEATMSAYAFLNTFIPTDLTGADLKRALVQFDPQTNAPNIGIEFNETGATKFADITRNNVDQVLGIFLDGYPLMLPRIQTAILDGRGSITGEFSLDEAKNLAIQLNAGALPVPIEVVEQQTVGASLGQDSVQKSIQAGVIGVSLVMAFMILLYGWSGFLADIALIIYAVLTVAIYKLFNVTLTLPGIAGLLLSVGMAVDANILIFERMKEEIRAGKPFQTAMNLGFGRAWDSIKDANVATIFTALVLINPLNLSFLNSSGLVRGFGVTLLIGVVISLFTGVVVTRTLLRLFLKEKI